MRLDAHRSASTWCFAIAHILQPRHRPFAEVGLQVPMSPTSLTLAVLPGGDAEEAQDVHCGICAAWRRAPVHCGRVMAGGPGSGAASSAAGETCPHSAAPGLQSTVPCHCVSDSQVHAALPWGPPTGLGGHVKASTQPATQVDTERWEVAMDLCLCGHAADWCYEGFHEF